MTRASDPLRFMRLFTFNSLLVSYKPLHIMANVKLIFQGTEESGTENYELQCFVNQFNDIAISINDEESPATIISLDISTAIKLSKVLRTEINIAKEIQND